VAEDEKTHGSAAELLADWRSAKRDTVAAGQTSQVAILALAAATAAEEAAEAVEAAASAAVEAVERARAAADRARKAAARAAEAAQLAYATAEGDTARAGHAMDKAEKVEVEARDRFHEAEEKGFPKK
jgi:hypothetical protein